MDTDRVNALLTPIGYAAVLTAVIIAVLTVRLMNDGKEGLKAANFAMETGKRDAAAASLEDAAKAYFPGSPFPRQALRELGIMARAAEIRGELTNAIAIWEQVRRSIIATRHLYQPNRDLLAEAEANLIRIRSDAGPLDLSIDLTYRRDDPSPFFSILIFVGLLIWIGGAALVALRPQNRNGSPLVRTPIALALSLVGIVLWVMGTALV